MATGRTSTSMNCSSVDATKPKPSLTSDSDPFVSIPVRPWFLATRETNYYLEHIIHFVRTPSLKDVVFLCILESFGITSRTLN